MLLQTHMDNEKFEKLKSEFEKYKAEKVKEIAKLQEENEKLEELAMERLDKLDEMEKEGAEELEREHIEEMMNMEQEYEAKLLKLSEELIKTKSDLKSAKKGSNGGIVMNNDKKIIENLKMDVLRVKDDLKLARFSLNKEKEFNALLETKNKTLLEHNKTLELETINKSPHISHKTSTNLNDNITMENKEKEIVQLKYTMIQKEKSMRDNFDHLLSCFVNSFNEIDINQNEILQKKEKEKENTINENIQLLEISDDDEDDDNDNDNDEKS